MADASTPTPPAEKEARPRRGRRRWLFRALAVLIPVCVVFTIGEVFVRYRYPIVDPRPYFYPGIYQSKQPPARWELLPDYVGEYHQQLTPLKTTTNALAMRDPPLTKARREAPKRVLVLGDSIAFGRGVADEAPFARRLEEVWGEGVAAFNGGVPGYDTRQEWDRLKRIGPEVRPHLVLLEWYRNDVLVPSAEVAATVIEGQLVTDEATYRRWKARYIDHTANPLDWSALIRFGRIHWKNFKMTAWKLEQRSKKPWELAPDDKGLAGSKRAIAAMRDWCKERKARFGVILFPAREEVERDGPPPSYPGYIVEFCRANEIRCIDLRDRWRAHWKKTQQTLYLPRDRCHPNAAGHAQVARWIGETFREDLPK